MTIVSSTSADEVPVWAPGAQASTEAMSFRSLAACDGIATPGHETKPSLAATRTDRSRQITDPHRTALAHRSSSSSTLPG
jgi:hypothetical protein